MNERNYYVFCDSNCKFPAMTKEQTLAAIAEAVATGKIRDVDSGFVTTVKTVTGTPLKFFVGTQAEYMLLSESEKENLFAIITNDTMLADLQREHARLQEAIDGIVNNGNPVPLANHATTADNATNAEYAKYAQYDVGGDFIATTYAKKPSSFVALEIYTLDGVKYALTRGLGYSAMMRVSFGAEKVNLGVVHFPTTAMKFCLPSVIVDDPFGARQVIRPVIETDPTSGYGSNGAAKIRFEIIYIIGEGEKNNGWMGLDQTTVELSAM